MFTRKIYQENVYKCTLNSKILEIDWNKQSIALMETIIFPEGGGQSSDKGRIDFNNQFIIETSFSYIYEDLVFHKIDNWNDFLESEFAKNIQNEKILLKDIEAKITLDWNHRFDNMQRHCGEHIFSGIWHRLYGGVNYGFHMGDDYMTIDILLKDNPEYIGKEITMEMALNVEKVTNEVIWKNLEVITRRFKTKEEAENLPLRKELTLEEDISIVSVGDIENPSDCVACCGTHPSKSGQVGLLKVYKIEKNKDMWRIYFDAGKRAMADYRKKHTIISDLCLKFSSNTDTILEKIEKLEKNNFDLKEKIISFKNQFKTILKNNIYLSSKSTENNYILLIEENLLTDEVIGVVKDIDTPPIIAINCINEKTLIIKSNSNTVDCKKLSLIAKEKYSLKGGGSTTLSRIIYQDLKEIDKFIKEIL